MIAVAACSLVPFSSASADPGHHSLQDASVTYARLVDADLATVRKAIADPSWSAWIPFLKADQCSGSGAGSKRVCTMADPSGKMDGYQLSETILENDIDSGRFVVSIDNPPLPAQNLRATVTSVAAGDKTMVTWTSEFSATPDQLPAIRKLMLSMYPAALDGLNRHLN